MTDKQLWNLGKVVGGVLVIIQLVITQAITNFVTDLALTRPQVAVLSLLVTAIGAALLYLPQPNKAAGNERGNSDDDKE